MTARDGVRGSTSHGQRTLARHRRRARSRPRGNRARMRSGRRGSGRARCSCWGSAGARRHTRAPPSRHHRCRRRRHRGCLAACTRRGASTRTGTRGSATRREGGATRQLQGWPWSMLLGAMILGPGAEGATAARAPSLHSQARLPNKEIRASQIRLHSQARQPAASSSYTHVGHPPTATHSHLTCLSAPALRTGALAVDATAVSAASIRAAVDPFARRPVEALGADALALASEADLLDAAPPPCETARPQKGNSVRAGRETALPQVGGHRLEVA